MGLPLFVFGVGFMTGVQMKRADAMRLHTVAKKILTRTVLVRINPYTVLTEREVRAVRSAERRNAIMEKLCRRRYDTTKNLAFEFGVSPRTIRRDIEILSYTEPIYTQMGRYGGGIYVVDGYYRNQLYLPDSEIGLLHKLCTMAERQGKCVLPEDELQLLKYMAKKYLKPKHSERKMKNEK